MSSDTPPPETEDQNTSADEMLEGERMSIFQEFVLFLGENKAYWLVPIFLALAFMLLLVVAGGSGAAPFIYTLF